MFTTTVVNSGRSSRSGRYRGGAGQGRDAPLSSPANLCLLRRVSGAVLLHFFFSTSVFLLFFSGGVLKYCWGLFKGCWEAVSAMAEENTARAVEGNVVRFRPSPLPGHVKPNAPNQDIAWDWNSLKDINNRNCHKCPEDVKETLKAAFINKKNERDAYLKETNDLDEDHELVEEISAIRQGKRAANMATSIASSQTASTAKKPKD
ncbi:hypothetical protein RJT34_20451 [Clitoria ternatea]|uniref:Uncharacterized protein n=1 Tax=Clitoria ternatea TaxID=43366 RepID=A0AAN9ITH8_CLITE